MTGNDLRHAALVASDPVGRKLLEDWVKAVENWRNLGNSGQSENNMSWLEDMAYRAVYDHPNFEGYNPYGLVRWVENGHKVGGHFSNGP